DVRVVCECNRGCPRRNFCNRRFDTLWTSPQVSQTSEPARGAARGHFQHLVIQNLDAVRFQRAPHAWPVPPPIVIAEHRVNTEWRAKLSQKRTKHFRHYSTAHPTLSRHVVAEYDDHVG